jgi:hypothetical protein
MFKPFTALMIGLAFSALGEGQSAGQTVTFARDIAPILQRSCQSCHNPGGIGPMSLVSYDQVRPWARAIKTKTARREMPPWFIEKNIGIQRFKDDTSLSDREIDLVSRWVDSGAPQGNPADLPASPARPNGSTWTIGTPDLVLSSPVLTVRPVAADFMTDIGPTPTGLTEDRYIQAVEVREISRSGDGNSAPGSGGSSGASGPGSRSLNYFLVHHASISISDARESARDAEPGDEGSGRRLVFYQMGQNPTIYPAGVGSLLPAGSALKFAVHVHSVGEALPLRLDVALKFYPKGVTPQYVLTPFSASPRFQHEELDLPAGESNIRVDGYTPVTRPMKLVTYVPHLHANGTRMCIEAVYPDGRTEMLNCSRWDHNWSRQYFYEDDAAPLLPAGTQVHVIAWFDNSAGNPRNIEPRNWKGYGNRTIDDMSFLLSEAVYLTDEQFKAEVAARAAKAR